MKRERNLLSIRKDASSGVFKKWKEFVFYSMSALDFRFQTRVASSESLIIAHSIENATAWIQHPMARVASHLSL